MVFPRMFGVFRSVDGVIEVPPKVRSKKAEQNRSRLGSQLISTASRFCVAIIGSPLGRGRPRRNGPEDAGLEPAAPLYLIRSQ